MNRIEKLKSEIKNDDIQALFITSPHNISYLTNILPMSIEEREYYLLVTENVAYVIAPKMFMMAIKEKLSGVRYIEITKEKSLYKIINDICKIEKIKSLGFERENLLYKEYEHLEDALSSIDIFPIEDFVEKTREAKDDIEIQNIKKACALTDSAYSYIIKEIRLNATERELSWKIENFIRENGGSLAFSSIVAFGKNAAVPHHIPTNQKLTKDSFVLFDMGAKVNGYCSDMSRTIFFGRPNEKQVKIYNTTLEAQQMAIEKLREWKNKDFEASHLHNIAQSHIEQMGYSAFPHAIGHGIGLEVHEAPTISMYTEGNPLITNSVITIEPGVYLPNIGGVRIEDTILLEEYGFEILTKSEKQLTILK